MISARRILVPVNGSPTDDDNIHLACMLARLHKGEIFVMYVIEVKRTLPLDAELLPESSRGEVALQRAEQLGREQRIDIRTELIQSRDVGSAIVDEAISRQADLIILGMPYRKQYGEFDIGKTAPYVLKHAPCRVWVAREPMP